MRLLKRLRSNPDTRRRRKRIIHGRTKRRTTDRGSKRPTGGDKAFGGKKQYFRRKKVCRFCVDKIDDINYKDMRLLGSFMSEKGKITPRRISGVCAPHQRRLAEAIKQARNIALIPFSTRSKNGAIMEVILREDIENLVTRRAGEGDAGLCAQFPAAAEQAVAANESNKKIVEQERQAYLRKDAKFSPKRRIWGS